MRKLREHQSFTATGVCESKPLCATGLGGPVAVETKSMNALIKVASAKIGDETINSVSARDLHKFLEVGKDFSTWMKDRIAAYDFEEGRDFSIFPEMGEKPGRGRPAKEYAISLDMAKELSMVERNEKGKQARQYFIDCERRANRDPVQVLNDPEAMRGLLLTYSEKVIELEALTDEMRPQVEALERISVADGSLCITDAAKALQMRPKDLFGFLSMNGWIYKRIGSSHWVGYQSKTQQGLLEHKVTTVLTANGDERMTEQVRVTPKGMTRLAQLIKPALKAA